MNYDVLKPYIDPEADYFSFALKIHKFKFLGASWLITIRSLLFFGAFVGTNFFIIPSYLRFFEMSSLFSIVLFLVVLARSPIARLITSDF